MNKQILQKVAKYLVFFFFFIIELKHLWNYFEFVNMSEVDFLMHSWIMSVLFVSRNTVKLSICNIFSKQKYFNVQTDTLGCKLV